MEKCGIKSGVLGHAEMEGKLTFNRTGKPLRTPGRPLPTPTPQHNRNGPASDVNNTHPGLNRAFSIAESKKTSDSLPKIEDKKGISSGAKQEDSRPTMKKGAALSMSLNGIDNSVKNSRDSLPPAPVIDPLGDVDVDMLTERFELDGCVHYGHFVQYFNELHAAVQMSRRKHVTLPPQSAASAASPFLVSSEWQKLRSSAVLQHYATAPPPPPTPALTQQQQPQTEPPTPKTSKPTPAVAEPKPATPAPADSKSMAKKGIDAADFQPGQLPPPKGVEVVEPSSGMFCCGGGSRAKAKNAPEPLLMPDRAEDKAAWVDPDEGGEEQEDAGEGKSQDDSSSGSEDRMPKVDRGFNTPVDRSKASKTKLSFQPRRVVREEESPEEDIQRSGLGKKDRHDVEVEEQQRGGAQRRNHFHRRDADTAGAAASTKANVSTSSSAARRRALESDSQSGSEEGFGAPRGVNSRWK